MSKSTHSVFLKGLEVVKHKDIGDGVETVCHSSIDAIAWHNVSEEALVEMEKVFNQMLQNLVSLGEAGIAMKKGGPPQQ